jgi:DNA-binding MarR family transcriptional regulator
MFTNAWISDRFRVVFKNFKLTAQQYNVLRILRGGYPEAMNPNEIKAVMIDKNPDLTRLCDRLVVLGYIDRCINDENKRKMNIRINDKGLEILNDIDPLMNAVQSEMHGLTDLEASQLSDLLDKLRNS